MTSRREHGFTLIEISIVLVIIGLIVGGVLVGQDLIKAAAVRAQISQIEKFNTAANTFYGKYGYLPGDIPNGPALQFGFEPRGLYAGQGDGNGILEGFDMNGASQDSGFFMATGETAMFWVDLSQAGLIDGGFNTATSTSTLNSSLSFSNYVPEAKLGGGNSLYVYSPFSAAWPLAFSAPPLGNYFGIFVEQTMRNGHGHVTSSPGMTVQQAYGIDAKIDDGLPQSGRVTALYLTFNGTSEVLYWAGTQTQGGPYTAATTGSSTTCFDNGNIAGAAQYYSLEISNGANVNCALSIQFQ